MRRLIFSFASVGFFLFAGDALAEEPKGGNNNGENGGNNNQNQKTEHVVITREELDRLIAAAAGKSKEKDKNKNKGLGKIGEDDEEDDEQDDLREKAAKDKETASQQAREQKRIETAISFNMGLDEYLKKNKDLLPAEIVDIVKVANKETYDTTFAKANAIKSGMIQSFFAVQANADALTGSQKVSLDDYLKLTKTGKEDKASQIYETIFEPALEAMRREKKALELGRSRNGYAPANDAQANYKERLMKGSRKTYLKEA